MEYIKCVIDGCNNNSLPREVHLNTYVDHSKRTRARLTATVDLCELHHYIHGFVWSSKPLPHYGQFPIDRELYGKKK